MVPNSAEQVALISSALVSIMVILVGDYYRSISRRELSDLHELHELSATLASIPGLSEQLGSSSRRSRACTARRRESSAPTRLAATPLTVAASISFGNSDLALVDRVRVVVTDTESDVEGGRPSGSVPRRRRALGAFDAADQS